MSEYFKQLLDKRVSVVTNDGKNYRGVLKAYDQLTNVVLNDTEELVFSSDAPCESIALGLFIIKGDNLAVIGEIDDSEPEHLHELRGIQLKPIQH